MKKLTVLSLGAGVQSSTLALMAAKGEITPMPDCAIFADTQWEPKQVYEWLDYLEGQLPFPVHRVTGGNLRADVVNAVQNKVRCSNPPFYTKAVHGDAEALLRRKCTLDYKISPINAKLRELLGHSKGQKVTKGTVTQWIGISLDEIQRMKEPAEKWLTHIWPLIDMKMNRHDCLTWLKKNNYPPPRKSACIGCPYHHNRVWREMKMNYPAQFADAVEFDKVIRAGLDGSNGPAFIHRSLKPLEDVDLRNDVDRGQLTFLDECDGMCGV